MNDIRPSKPSAALDDVYEPGGLVGRLAAHVFERNTRINTVSNLKAERDDLLRQRDELRDQVARLQASYAATSEGRAERLYAELEAIGA